MVLALAENALVCVIKMSAVGVSGNRQLESTEPDSGVRELGRRCLNSQIVLWLSFLGNSFLNL